MAKLSMEDAVTVSLDTFLQGLTDEERRAVEARTKQFVAEELARRAEGVEGEDAREHWTAGGTVQMPLVAVVGLPVSPDLTTHQAGMLPATQPPGIWLLWSESQKALDAALEQIGKPDRLAVLILPAFLADAQQLTPGTSVIAIDRKEQAVLVAQSLFGAILSPGMIAVDIADIAPVMAGRRFRLAGFWQSESWEAVSNSLAHCEIPHGAAYLVTITMPTYMTLSELDGLFRQIESKLPSNATLLHAAPFSKDNLIATTCLVADSYRPNGEP